MFRCIPQDQAAKRLFGIDGDIATIAAELQFCLLATKQKRAEPDTRSLLASIFRSWLEIS